MKKLFFFTVINFDHWKIDGICKKILSQVKVFREEGYEVELVYLLNMDTYLDINGEKVCLGRRKGFINKGTACKYMQEYIKDRHYDAVYIRYGFAERNFYRLLKALSERTEKLVIEIATYPYDGEFSRGFDRKVALLLDKLYRNRMKKFAKRIVTFSKDEQIFGIQTIKLVNGIDFAKIRIRNIHSNSDCIQMIAVASMSMWHGYDRILRGLGKYYQNGGMREIVLHMVGNGEEIPKYKQLVSEYGIEKRVIFYGVKTGEELEIIYDQCNIAVASLGMHRFGVYLASTLKTREYAAKGLPIITSSEIDIFPSDQFSFICKFNEDESDIDIEQVIGFYDSLHNNTTESEIANRIRRQAEEVCDMHIAMRPVIEYFES